MVNHRNEKKITSQTLQKQKYALQNITNKCDERKYIEGWKEWDREKCAENYKDFLEQVKDGSAIMKGKRVNIVDYVKDAILANKYGHQDTIDTINAQWTNHASTTGVLRNFVAMVDTSGSMSSDGGNALYAALGLGISCGREVDIWDVEILTFSASPEWINLKDCDTFTQMVDKINKSNWGMNTNFYAAMKLILDVIVENMMPAADVKDMVLAVFSDMQIDNSKK